MLNQVNYIEGLEDSYELSEEFSDTPPDEAQVSFKVASEEMPFLSNQEGRVVRQNFIHITVTKDLGRTSFTRRIRDVVEWKEAQNKWVIKKLSPNSDIRRWPNQWNAFMRGAAASEVGAPLTVIFKNDPARAEYYKSVGIRTVEQLAAQGSTNLEQLGMGARADAEKARAYLKKVTEQAGNLAINHKLEEKDKRILSLESQVTELVEKLNQVLSSKAPLDDEIAVPRGDVVRRRGRPAKVKPQEKTVNYLSSEREEESSSSLEDEVDGIIGLKD